MDDPHKAPKSEIIEKDQSSNAEFSLAKLQWNKDDIEYSLHVSPNTFSTSGIQVTDFLNFLNFERSQCSFVDGRQCYVRWVNKGFDTSAFAKSFDVSFQNMTDAQNHLKKCGFFFNQPEGWGYFFGKKSGGKSREFQMTGDGHTSMSNEQMKESVDDVFRYKFTWLEKANDKGWVIHYRPKHPPLSSELQSVFAFLGLEKFEQCPEYDFNPCYWNSIAFSKINSAFGDNANDAHGWFDSHKKHFSLGVQKLLSAHAEIEKHELDLLSFQKPTERLDEDIEKRTKRPKSSSGLKKDSPFDVAISFAGSEREHAEELAQILEKEGFSVFYDGFYSEHLWGKNLMDTFDEIFRKRARHCVIFVSEEYKERMWTNHERQSAQARALKEGGEEYILPIKVDDVELDGMPSTIGYTSIEKGVDEIANLLIKKLES